MRREPWTTTAPLDLVVHLVLTPLCWLAVVLDAAPALRIAAGLLLCLALPGYGLMAMLYPDGHRVGQPTDPTRRPRSLHPLDRASFSAVASIVLVALCGVTLSFLPVGITVHSMAHVVAALSLGFGLLALFLRLGNVPADRRLAFRIPRPDVSWLTVVAFLAIAGSLAGLIAALVAVNPLFDPEPGYTSLYVAPVQQAACYPLVNNGTHLAFAAGSPCAAQALNLSLQIVNHNGADRRYVLVTYWDASGSVKGRIANDGQQLEDVTLPDAGPVPNGIFSTDRQHSVAWDVPPLPGKGTWFLTAALYETSPGGALPDEPTHSVQLRVVLS